MFPLGRIVDVLQSIHFTVKSLAHLTDTYVRIYVCERIKNEVLSCRYYVKINYVLTNLDGKYSDVETTDLMDLANFIDPWFITDYICR